MIKLFRKIRQNLIMENKTSKYFKYAIGEIVLVVIGILIALQVNNWNEVRKESKQEIYLLNQLRQEFQADSSLVNSYIRLTKLKKNEGEILKKAVTNKRYTIPKDSVVKYAFFNGRVLLFEASLPTFEELLSSGRLYIIKNEKLKAAIKRYKKTNEGSKSFIYNESQKRKEAYNSHIYKYFEPQIMTYLWESGPSRTMNIDSLKKYKIDVKGFFDDPETLINQAYDIQSEKIAFILKSSD